jgi:carbon storage regulator
MLVLTRRMGEEIVIAGDIHITITMVQGEKVRLGITAPAWVRVDRQEVHDRRTVSPTEPQPRPGPQRRPARVRRSAATQAVSEGQVPEALLVRSSRGRRC